MLRTTRPNSTGPTRRRASWVHPPAWVRVAPRTAVTRNSDDVPDIESHLSELYGVEIKRDTISRVTDAILEDLAAWRTRPLDAVYPIAYFDCLMVKVREDRSVRTRACYLAIGVSCEGEREVLGIWWQETEGAKFWLAVLNDLHHRGVEDVLVACVDGLTGFPEAIEAVFPQAWAQTCIVHQIRSSMPFVAYQDRTRVAAELKPVYRAINADAAAHALKTSTTNGARSTR
jgi:putative transposase